MDNATPACLTCGRPVARRNNCGPKPKYCFDVECRKERARTRALAWYYERIEDPEFRAARLIQVAKAGKKWRDKNPDLVKASIVEYRKANPQAIAEQYRRWRIANADRVLEKTHRRRARLLAAFVEQVDPEKIWERDGSICQLCKEPVDPDLKWPDPLSRSFDHIVPLSKGGTHEFANVQLAHAVCNSIKGNRYVA